MAFENFTKKETQKIFVSAVLVNELDLVHEAVICGADVFNLFRSDGKGAIHFAAECNNLSLLRVMVNALVQREQAKEDAEREAEEGLPPSSSSSPSHPSSHPPHQAATTKTPLSSKVQNVLTNFLHLRDAEGWTPLHYAVHANAKEVLLYLIQEQHVDSTVPDTQSRPAIYYAKGQPLPPSSLLSSHHHHQRIGHQHAEESMLVLLLKQEAGLLEAVDFGTGTEGANSSLSNHHSNSIIIIPPPSSSPPPSSPPPSSSSSARCLPFARGDDATSSMPPPPENAPPPLVDIIHPTTALAETFEQYRHAYQRYKIRVVAANVDNNTSTSSFPSCTSSSLTASMLVSLAKFLLQTTLPPNLHQFLATFPPHSSLNHSASSSSLPLQPPFRLSSWWSVAHLRDAQNVALDRSSMPSYTSGVAITSLPSHARVGVAAEETLAAGAWLEVRPLPVLPSFRGLPPSSSALSSSSSLLNHEVLAVSSSSGAAAVRATSFIDVVPSRSISGRMSTRSSSSLTTPSAAIGSLAAEALLFAVNNNNQSTRLLSSSHIDEENAITWDAYAESNFTATSNNIEVNGAREDTFLAACPIHDLTLLLNDRSSSCHNMTGIPQPKESGASSVWTWLHLVCASGRHDILEKWLRMMKARTVTTTTRKDSSKTQQHNSSSSSCKRNYNSGELYNTDSIAKSNQATFGTAVRTNDVDVVSLPSAAYHRTTLELHHADVLIHSDAGITDYSASPTMALPYTNVASSSSSSSSSSIIDACKVQEVVKGVGVITTTSTSHGSVSSSPSALNVLQSDSPQTVLSYHSSSTSPRSSARKKSGSFSAQNAEEFVIRSQLMQNKAPTHQHHTPAPEVMIPVNTTTKFNNASASSLSSSPYTNSTSCSSSTSSFSFSPSPSSSEPAPRSSFYAPTLAAAVNTRGGGYNISLTPLHLASMVTNDNPRTVLLLVAAGADITATDAGGRTALHCAASCNNAVILRTLLKILVKKSKVSDDAGRGGGGKTKRVKEKAVSSVKQSLAKLATSKPFPYINTATEVVATTTSATTTTSSRMIRVHSSPLPFPHESQEEAEAVSKITTTASATSTVTPSQITSTKERNTSSILPLISCEDDAITKALRMQDYDRGWNPLHFASFFGAKDAAQIITSYISASHSPGKVPLINSPAAGKPEITTAPLSSIGAGVSSSSRNSATSENGGNNNKNNTKSVVTALHLAAFAGHSEVVLALLAAGADPLLEDPVSHRIPLHDAATNGHIDVAYALMGLPYKRIAMSSNDGSLSLPSTNKNIDIDTKSRNRKKSFFHVPTFSASSASASHHHRHHVWSVIHQDVKGRSPIQDAISNGHEKCALHLLAALGHVCSTERQGILLDQTTSQICNSVTAMNTGSVTGTYYWYSGCGRSILPSHLDENDRSKSNINNGIGYTPTPAASSSSSSSSSSGHRVLTLHTTPNAVLFVPVDSSLSMLANTKQYSSVSHLVHARLPPGAYPFAVTSSFVSLLQHTLVDTEGYDITHDASSAGCVSVLALAHACGLDLMRSPNPSLRKVNENGKSISAASAAAATTASTYTNNVLLAAIQGRSRVLEFFLAAGVNCGVKDRNDDTALHWSSFKGHVNCVRVLLKAALEMKMVVAAATTTTTTTTTTTSESQVTRMGLPPSLQFPLLPLTFQNDGMASCITVASSSMQSAVYKTSLKALASAIGTTNSTTSASATAATTTTTTTSTAPAAASIVVRSPSHGINLHAKNADGGTACHSAANNGSIMIGQMLMVAGQVYSAMSRSKSSESSNNSSSNSTSIMGSGTSSAPSSSSSSSSSISPFDPNITMLDKNTALHNTSFEGHSGFTKLLLAWGADPNVANDEHRYPLLEAADNGHAKALDILLSGTPLVMPSAAMDLSSSSSSSGRASDPTLSSMIMDLYMKAMQKEEECASQMHSSINNDDDNDCSIDTCVDTLSSSLGSVREDSMEEVRVNMQNLSSTMTLLRFVSFDSDTEKKKMKDEDTFNAASSHKSGQKTKKHISSSSSGHDSIPSSTSTSDGVLSGLSVSPLRSFFLFPSSNKGKVEIATAVPGISPDSISPSFVNGNQHDYHHHHHPQEHHVTNLTAEVPHQSHGVPSAFVTSPSFSLKANVNARDAGGDTALHWASCHNHSKCTYVLLSHGADTSLYNVDGGAVLHACVINNAIDCLRVMLMFATSPPTRSRLPALSSSSSSSSSISAAAAGPPNPSPRIDINIKFAALNSNNVATTRDTPLIIAASDGRVKCLQLLVDAGADLEVLNERKRTALGEAARNKQKEAAQILLDAGASLSVVDETGRTPLGLLLPRVQLPVLNAMRVPHVPQFVNAAGNNNEGAAVPPLFPVHAIEATPTLTLDCWKYLLSQRQVEAPGTMVPSSSSSALSAAAAAAAFVAQLPAGSDQLIYLAAAAEALASVTSTSSSLFYMPSFAPAPRSSLSNSSIGYPLHSRVPQPQLPLPPALLSLPDSSTSGTVAAAAAASASATSARGASMVIPGVSLALVHALSPLWWPANVAVLSSISSARTRVYASFPLQLSQKILEVVQSAALNAASASSIASISAAAGARHLINAHNPNLHRSPLFRQLMAVTQPLPSDASIPLVAMNAPPCLSSPLQWGCAFYFKVMKGSGGSDGSSDGMFGDGGRECPFTDLTLITPSGVRVRAHKVIIASRAASLWSLLMFGSGLSQQQQQQQPHRDTVSDEVQVSMEVDVLVPLLSFLYTGRLGSYEEVQSVGTGRRMTATLPTTTSTTHVSVPVALALMDCGDAYGIQGLCEAGAIAAAESMNVQHLMLIFEYAYEHTRAYSGGNVNTPHKSAMNAQAATTTSSSSPPSELVCSCWDLLLACADYFVQPSTAKQLMVEKQAKESQARVEYEVACRLWEEQEMRQREKEMEKEKNEEEKGGHRSRSATLNDVILSVRQKQKHHHRPTSLLLGLADEVSIHRDHHHHQNKQLHLSSFATAVRARADSYSVLSSSGSGSSNDGVSNATLHMHKRSLSNLSASELIARVSGLGMGVPATSTTEEEEEEEEQQGGKEDDEGKEDENLMKSAVVSARRRRSSIVRVRSSFVEKIVAATTCAVVVTPASAHNNYMVEAVSPSPSQPLAQPRPTMRPVEHYLAPYSSLVSFLFDEDFMLERERQKKGIRGGR